MYKSDDKLWKPISIGSQFELHRGRESKTTVDAGGKLPFVSAKKTDNGYRMFVKTPSTRISRNTLSLNNNGDGGAGFGYYQPYEYTIDVNTTALVPHQNIPMNKHIGLFWVSCFTWMHDYFGNARTLSNKRAKTTRIMLPVTDSGCPDYEYMAEYVQELRKKMLIKYQAYVKKRIAELGDYVEIPTLSEKKWGAVHLTDVFDSVSRGKRLKKADHVEGNIPYVSSTALTNGNDGTCGNSEGVRKFAHCLTLANSGSVGSCFYHPYQFVASDHVTALQRTGMSEFGYLALSALVGRLGEKYNFNREINDARISRERIMLPITDSGEPDYEYMEQYIKNMMLQKYRQYLTFIDDKIE